MDMKTTLKTSVAVGALFALAAPVASGSAEAGFKNQNSKVNLTMGGQIVRSLLHADDGERTQLFNIDGRSTGTRVRYIVSGQLTESVKVGGLLEHDVGQSNDSFDFTGSGVGDEVHGNTTAFGIRHHHMTFSHKSMGKLTIGRANTASNGTSEVGLNGAGDLVLGGNTMLSTIEFTTGTGGAFSGITAASQTSTFDGMSRDDVVRYDSPKIGGFALATSLLDNGVTDVALRYGGKVAGLTVKAAASYVNRAGATSEGTAGAIESQYSMSGAVKHESGLNARVGYGSGRAENSGTAPKTVWYGLGYSAKMSSLGATNLFVERYDAEDIAVAGREMETTYVGVSQKLDSIGSTLGLLYGKHELTDAASVDYNDIDTVMLQTKLTF
ncbi:MAG: hypothetical protein CMF65_13030 [Magnetovibrio sp.]|nr:hypothetical protein [Magnetovibrio sp.]